MYFAGLWTMIALDGLRRLRPAALAAAAAPYIIGALCWGAYILQDTEAFRSQLSANSYKRIGITQPVAAAWSEITGRYLPAFGFPTSHSAGHTGPIRLKIIPLVFYLASVLLVASVPAIRRQPGVSRLLLITCIHMLYLTFFEGMKFPYYLVHIIPLYCCLMAVAGMWAWHLRRAAVWRCALAAVLVMLGVLQIGGVMQRVRLNTYGTMYVPAIAFLRQHAGPSDLINGTSDLGFGLGFVPNLVDDGGHLGYETGRRARFVVLEEAYESNLQAWKTSKTALQRTVSQFASDRLQREYRLVYNHAGYRIYELRPEAGPASRPHI
jgi:hypothetical protein